MEIRAVEDEQIEGHHREGFRERNQWVPLWRRTQDF
jgi:hypothetical protein